MSNIDNELIKQNSISTRELINLAGNEIGKIIIEYINNINDNHIKRFVIIIGKGNNGGDSVVAASYIKKYTNKEIILYSLYPIDKLNENTQYYIRFLDDNIKIEVIDDLSDNKFIRGDIIIDGMLGTGFIGKLKPKYISWIDKINNSNLPVISVDIPSGLNGETGIVQDNAIISDLTITIGLPKIGLIINDGLKYVGKLEIADINIPNEIINKINHKYSMFTNREAYNLIKRVPIDSNKKNNGKILIIGGSSSYTGAPFITANAALKSGAGFVTVAIPKEIKPDNIIINSSLIIKRINDDGTGYFCKSSIKEIKELINHHDILVVGPGMSNNIKCIPLLKEILSYKKRTVIDADALNLMSIDPNIIINCDNFVYTPHSEEMNRLLTALDLTKYIDLDKTEKASILASKILGTIVAKGNKTAVVNKNRIPSINNSGSQALAKAGSGDVLSGIIGAFLSLDNNIQDLVCLAVYIHGLTATLSNDGFRGLTADDIIQLIPKAIKSISPFG